MNITYTGRQGVLPANLQKKLDARFAKFAKYIERNGVKDKGAHVAVSTERHLTHAEITTNYYDHTLVGLGSGPDFFTAIYVALDKAEQQALKLKAKFRDTKRGPKDKSIEGAPSTPAPKAVAGAKPKKSAKPAPVEADDEGPHIFRVNQHEKRKPMTLEEAMIAIGARDYLVYRDADKNRVTTLIRRKDGNFDLVEA